VLPELGQRRIETEASLDADREQVQRVRQVGTDLLLAAPRLERQRVVRAEEADRAGHQSAKQQADGAACRAEHRTGEDTDEGEQGLEREEAGGRDPPAQSGRHQPA
jgi:hypothetical protein